MDTHTNMRGFGDFLQGHRGWALVALVMVGYVGWTLLRVAHTILRGPLRKVPGPFPARFSRMYRAYHVSTGNGMEWYRQLHTKYGAIVRTAPHAVSVSGSEALTTIYGINSKFVKSNFFTMFDAFYQGAVMPTMFSTTSPQLHQDLRRPVASKFSMSSIKSMEPYADDNTQIFIDAMHDLQGRRVDLGEWLQWYAFDVVAAITFNRSFGFMEQRKDVGHMINDIEKLLMYAAVVGQVPEWNGWLLGNNWVAKMLAVQPFFRAPDPMRTIVAFTDKCIEEYDRDPPSGDRPDFLGGLRGQSLKGKPISHPDMVNHLSNNLLAGSDTTAISLRAIFYYLIKNPKCYAKAVAEIDQADKEGKLSEYVTYAESLELPYLQAVMKESMRCHPGAALPFERVVPEGGATICGVHLPAGTVVGINPAVMHNDKTIFGEDSESFNPDRWLGPDQERIKVMDRHFISFGYGSRTCIGKNISLMEMGKFVPMILRHFDLEWASDKPTWKVGTYWLNKQHGLICRFKSRQKDF